MKNYLHRIADIRNTNNPGYLLAAWKALYGKSSPRQRRNTSGIDDETLEEIKQKEYRVLGELSSRILDQEGYKFSSLKPVLIEKDNGKTRVICIPTCRDRIVQKSIQLAISDRKTKFTSFNGINFGFIRNYGVKDAIKKATELRNSHPYIYKTDISAFFDNIDRDTLKHEIRKKIKLPSLYRIIESAVDLEIETDDSSSKRRIKGAGIIEGRGVRQGMPLSPLFANIYLTDLDIEILKRSIPAIRYADDLIFFSDTKDNCLAIHTFVKSRLNKIGLEIPDIAADSKTKILNPDQIVEFLGIGIERKNGKYLPVITDKQKEDIRASIFRFSDINYLFSKEITLPRLYSAIRATIKGYDGVFSDCTDYIDVQNMLREWAKSAIRDLFLKNYGFDIYKLNEAQKSFVLDY